MPPTGSPPPPRILVLAGSTSGTATAVAEKIASVLKVEGLDAAARSMAGLGVPDLAGHDGLVLCVATFGAGGVPDSARDFLKSLNMLPHLIPPVPCALVGLGDRGFRATYNGGHRHFEAALARAGARQIVEKLLLDAADLEPWEPRTERWAEAVASAFLQGKKMG